MSSSSSSLSLFLFVLLFIQTVLGQDPLFHFCFDSGNFTANDPYEANLQKLADSLSDQALSSGFAVASVGQSPSTAFGLTLCRGDVSSSDCKTCIVDASAEIRRRCPYNKGAVIWYDNCLLKYSDEEFVGRIDNQHRFYMWNVRKVSNPGEFNEKIKELLSKLAEEAYESPKLYAGGESELGGSTKLFGLTQCTRDLSSEVCKMCLDGIIGELPRCCDGQEGGRVVGPNCNFRYEIYPFLNDHN